VRSSIISLLVFSLCCIAVPLSSETNAPSVVAGASAEPHRGDIPDIVRETQLGIRAPGYSGLIWWVPTDFWIQSSIRRGISPERAAETYRPLQEYTVALIFVAKVSDLGVFEFVPPDQLQKKVFLRDATANEYAALPEVSDAAKNLAGIMKPLLANAMGKAGENITMLFFPAKNKAGALIADASAKGSFQIVLKDTVGLSQDVYEWRLPLTSLSPAKYCPAGKERVNANWTYCPWHGVALDNSTVAKGAK
jgi:hypothetical protein